MGTDETARERGLGGTLEEEDAFGLRAGDKTPEEVADEAVAALDEEPELDPEEPSEGAGAWQRYDLVTLPDGSIQGRTATNDDQDRGYPNDYEEWEVTYKDKASMLKQLGGGSHYGASGVRVEVWLDGEEVGEPLTRREPERLL